MLGIEDLQDASEQDDTQEETTETEEIGNEIASSIEESDSLELSEKLSEEVQEEIKEKKREEATEKERKEEGQEETSSSKETRKEEISELATVTRSTSSDDGGVPVSVLGVAARQAEPGVPRIAAPSTSTVGDGDGQRRHIIGGPSTAVGEWNSLPILVERLREALELSLAAGYRRGGGGDGGDESTASSLAESGVDVGIEGGGDRSRARRSMEQILLSGGSGGGYDHGDPELKKDELKFLEDLLLLDVQTALSRLRETLERTDVATLAKHGGVSDPTSKLHLLRLVSSLLSRLQVPEKIADGENRMIDLSPNDRKRRGIRHTIGVSAEEIAHARRQMEESGNADLTRLNEQVSAKRREAPLPVSRNVTNNERYVEEIHDKYTKDVINQRQSLRDKNKDSRGDVGAYRPLVPLLIGYGDRSIVAETTSESDMHQVRRRSSIDNYHQEKENDDDAVTIREASEEQSQMTKLAAALRQRAEMISANKCSNGNNKFTAKKSKIKRANTIDIPSYLKLQAGNLGYDNPGCVLLRRPINVGDKVVSNASNLIVPSFYPKTENDKKFLALINRNNETQAYNAAPVFVKKPFGHTKATDMNSNENWNSRFSNIKTAFDKPSTASDENKLSPKLSQTAKRFSCSLFQTPPQMTNKKTPNASMPDTGFKHAPSSLFRKIEKPQYPKSSPSYHYQRDASPPGNTLREKARIMFDQDGVEFQLPSGFNANENIRKSSFPRLPWIKHDRNEGKSSNTVTENGRLDYRLFCKQFAPFIGKNTVPEPKRSHNHEKTRKHNENPNAPSKNFMPSNEKLSAVEGKISSTMFPEKVSQLQWYRSCEPCREVEEPAQDKFNLFNEKNMFEPTAMYNDENLFGTALSGNASVDAAFRDNSSVASQTGINGNDHLEKERMFSVTHRASKSPPSTYNNASVQIYNEPEVTLKEQRITPRYERKDLNSVNSDQQSNLVLDHNRNYCAAVANDVLPRNEILVNKNGHGPMKNVSFQSTSHSPEQSERLFQMNSQYENCISSKPETYNRSQMYQDYLPYVKSDPFGDETSYASRKIDKEDSSRTNDDALPEEQNIQNQDISADAGIVTRYTCAIATVASADVLETRSDEARTEFEVSTSSPTQLWSRSKSIGNELIATEDEIRRHNMLQQSLIRRLQNEHATLNYHYAPIPKQSDSLSQPKNFNLSNNINQSSKFQPPKFQLPEAPKRLKPPGRLEPPKMLKLPVVTDLLSVAPSSELGTTNRVTALREQYEQPDGQLKKSVQKERSPIPNCVDSAIDSSDEYLVSCASKPSRSIVLSKSESWHQLALSKNHRSSPRLAQIDLPPQPLLTSYLPKPPKPKSPVFRMKKQYEASSSSDSVRKMENKIRRYFDSPNDSVETKDSKGGRRFSSHDSTRKSLVGLSRSRTMPGICDERMRLLIPTAPQIPVMNLNSAEVEKVFDDLFEEATRADDHRF